MPNPKLFELYEALKRKMQAGVAIDLSLDGDTNKTHKYLRIGLNTCMCDHGALVHLLVSKGLITEEEYAETITRFMEKEVDMYERALGERFGKPVKLHGTAEDLPGGKP